MRSWARMLPAGKIMVNKVSPLSQDSPLPMWYTASMGFYDDFLIGLERAATVTYKNPHQLALALGVETNLITRWLKRDRIPKAETMGKVLDALGARIVFPDAAAVGYSPSVFDIALAEVLDSFLSVHNLTHEKAASSLWPETANGAAKLGRILTAKEPLTPEVLMQLCLLMEEDPGKLLRLARERVQPEGEQISGNAKSA